MTNFEMVERLRMKANVSYEEAKAALEAASWDLLDAMVLLEQQGKVNNEDASCYTTREEPSGNAQKDQHDVKGFMKKVGEKIVGGINYLCRNAFEISHKEKEVLRVPVLALVLLLLFALWPTLIVLVAGLFFGLRYAFRGPDLEKNSINGAMGKAADVAESIKQDVQHGAEDKKD